MKSLLLKSFALLFMFALADAGVSYAQLAGTVTFTTSSSFVVEKTTLPPGTYTMHPFSDDPDLIELTSSAGHSVVFACEPTDASAAKSELTFHRYGSSLYLKQVSSGGNACFVPAGPLEKKAKKSGKPTKETVPVS